MKTNIIFFISLLLATSLCSPTNKLKPTPEEPSEIRNLVEASNLCGLTISRSLCIDNGNVVIGKVAPVKGLVGRWTFDDETAVDSSSRLNHAQNKLKHGFSLFEGNSAYFKGNYLKVPFDESLQSDNYTYTFWIYLLEDFEVLTKDNTFCPILQKGQDNSQKSKFNRSPSIQINREVRSIRIVTSTKSDPETQGEYFDSNARLHTNRWYHIAVTKGDRTISLRVNGVLDSHSVLKEQPYVIKESLFIGNTPEFSEKCSLPFYMDELKAFNRELSEEEIGAQAVVALGGIEAAAVRIGCFDCSIEEAEDKCGKKYHLCYQNELYGGAYQLARGLGWVNSKSSVWVSSDLANKEQLANMKAVALCCRD